MPAHVASSTSQPRASRNGPWVSAMPYSSANLHGIFSMVPRRSTALSMNCTFRRHEFDHWSWRRVMHPLARALQNFRIAACFARALPARLAVALSSRLSSILPWAFLPTVPRSGRRSKRRSRSFFRIRHEGCSQIAEASREIVRQFDQDSLVIGVQLDGTRSVTQRFCWRASCVATRWQDDGTQIGRITTPRKLGKPEGVKWWVEKKKTRKSVSFRAGGDAVH